MYYRHEDRWCAVAMRPTATRHVCARPTFITKNEGILSVVKSPWGVDLSGLNGSLLYDAVSRGPYSSSHASAGLSIRPPSFVSRKAGHSFSSIPVTRLSVSHGGFISPA